MSKEKFSPILRLYKYRPTVKNTPSENFLTEAFAICLFYNPNIAKTFLQKTVGISTTAEIIIDTQVRADDEKSIFDLILSDNKSYAVFIECKLGAGIGKNKTSNTDQIDKYVTYIKGLTIKNKKLLLIEQGASSIKNVNDVAFTTTSWNDIKNLIETQTGQNEIGEFIRLSFLDLLNHLKVDRKLVGDRLSWRCELCGLETIGQGIYSHQRKHEKDEKYRKVIDDINHKIRNTFDNKIAPYEKEFLKLIRQINPIGKIDKNNFSKRQEITNLLVENLPKETWLYFIDKIKSSFSNKAFIDYRSEIERELKDEYLELIVEPNYIMTTYDNILRHINT